MYTYIMGRENIKTSNGLLARMQVVQFGKILFNLQFVALAVMLASVVSQIFVMAYYLVLIMVAFLTLFTLFFSPEFQELWSAGEAFTDMANAMAASWTYTVPILAAVSAASIICLCFDKNNKHIARIVVSAVVCLIAVIMLIVKLTNGAGVA